ncbi:SprT-like domain-containing protein [Microcella daejeonensis]|uniref:SprT-like domain-containing protein n=1 Tax=Microcella daejeonensis TaxID=2994971 RepID=A0A9E8MN90_9MICO|nr:SprT-like domain-containing protein [Microcella daejeonensis]WAB82616.1 SprT-like domain-containing protein [Microcella daejeonensis]
MSELDRVRVWAEALIRLHLDPIDSDPPWSFGFDHATRRAGLCNYTDKRITVSRHLAARWDDDEIHQTLLHEVAHALAGPGTNHGPEWKRIAAELGYVGGTTHTGPVAEERARWRGHCPSGHEHVRFRRPAKPVSCGKCSRTFSRAHLIRWTDARAGA